jgi:hypothetical protein
MLMTCSKCGSSYYLKSFRNEDLSRGVDPDEWLRDAVNKLATMAPDDPPESRVTREELFEAALGTLSMVADELSGVQAAKIRGAIDVLLTFTKKD